MKKDAALRWFLVIFYFKSCFFLFLYLIRITFIILCCCKWCMNLYTLMTKFCLEIWKINNYRIKLNRRLFSTAEKSYYEWFALHNILKIKRCRNYFKYYIFHNVKYIFAYNYFLNWASQGSILNKYLYSMKSILSWQNCFICYWYTCSNMDMSPYVNVFNWTIETRLKVNIHEKKHRLELV